MRRPGVKGLEIRVTGLLVLICFLLPASFSISDEVNYIYDDTGQLIGAFKSTEGVAYQYDANGNLVAATDGAASAGSPSINSVTPDVLFIGATTNVVITGSRLFSTKSITSVNSHLTGKLIAATETRVSASITVSSDAPPELSKLAIKTIYGSAFADVTLSGSRVEFVPDVLSLAPGGSGIIAVYVIPFVNPSVTLWLTNGDPSVISIPGSITVPGSGMTTFEVNALAEGSARIGSSGGNSSIYVAPSFSLSAGESASANSKPVSVFIDSQTMEQTHVTALPASVFIDSQIVEPAHVMALPVSIFIDSQLGYSTVVSTSVSVKISQ